DEDVIAGSPSKRHVSGAPTDDVRDPGIAFPPALVSPGESPRGPGLGADNGIPEGDGAHTHRGAGVCHIPDLVGRIGIAAQHVDLVVVDRERAAVAYTDHLRPAPWSTDRSIGHREVEEVCREPRIAHIDD